jgi:hypothetical protein
MHSLYFLCFIGLILSTFVSCQDWFNDVKVLRDGLVTLTSSPGKIDFSSHYQKAFLLDSQIKARQKDIMRTLNRKTPINQSKDIELAKLRDELSIIFPELGVRALSSCLSALVSLKNNNLAEAQEGLKMSLDLDNQEWEQLETDLISKLSEIQTGVEPVNITPHIETANKILSYYTSGPTIKVPDEDGGNLDEVQISLENAINILPRIDDPNKPVECIEIYLEDIMMVLDKNRAMGESDMSTNSGPSQGNNWQQVHSDMDHSDMDQTVLGQNRATEYENLKRKFDMYAKLSPSQRKN